MRFAPAVRENVGLIVGLAGSTGSGKTYSAMVLASGICGGEPFGVIDTENRRALHYADQFKFDHLQLEPPFSPERYIEAIKAAGNRYKCLVVDSMSHSWAGEGGVSEMQEEEFQRLGGRDQAKLLSWAKPKAAHKRMVGELLRAPCHLILCLRAEEKTKMMKDARGKMVPTNVGWQPICEKNLPFELTVSLLMVDSAPGLPIPIKLQEQHRALFPTDRPIDKAAGHGIAKWASGGSAPHPNNKSPMPRIVKAIKAADSEEELQRISAKAAAVEGLTGEEKAEIAHLCMSRLEQIEAAG